MRLTDITWPKAKEYFSQNDTVLLSIGSVECHGRHMPLGTDTLIPAHLLKRIEPKTDVLIAPTLPFGACDYLAEYPGTINLGEALLYELFSRVCQEFYRHGARHFVVLNGHGGNRKAIEQVARDLQRQGALLAELNWWLMAWDLNPAWKGGHGGGEETAAILGIDERLVDRSEIGPQLKFFDLTGELHTTGFSSVQYNGVTVEIPRVTNTVTDSGWIGPDHPDTATPEWGREMLAATANYIVDFMEAFKKAPLSVPEKP